MNSYLENVRYEGKNLLLMTYSTLFTSFCLYVYIEECECLSKRWDLRKILSL